MKSSESPAEEAGILDRAAAPGICRRFRLSECPRFFRLAIFALCCMLGLLRWVEPARAFTSESHTPPATPGGAPGIVPSSGEAAGPAADTVGRASKSKPATVATRSRLAAPHVAPAAGHSRVVVVTQPRRPNRTGRMVVVSRGGSAQSAGDPPESSPEPAAGSFNLDAFMARLGLGGRSTAAGGPYVALEPGHVPPSQDPEALALLKTLPLTAPLDQYQFESSFGVRVDPINGHHAMHTGIDLSASYRAPVYSTSPGEIVFAGYAAAYGKMVEIDHGNGIHTRYAHLNRLTVNVGQHVKAHDQIGLLGSTGRSTGPHVHYEVLVNGVAQDPVRFLSAGREVSLLKVAQ
jgi:murein DD-endopeptidase MepM/ murein hydrolase activator NlpD